MESFPFGTCLIFPPDYIEFMHSRLEHCLGDVMASWERHTWKHTMSTCSSRVMATLIKVQSMIWFFTAEIRNYLSPLQQRRNLWEDTLNPYQHPVPHQNVFLCLESIDDSCLICKEGFNDGRNCIFTQWLQNDSFPSPRFPCIYQ